jgi:hypothetical protein
MMHVAAGRVAGDHPWARLRGEMPPLAFTSTTNAMGVFGRSVKKIHPGSLVCMDYEMKSIYKTFSQMSI